MPSEFFVSNGTFTWPDDETKALVEVWGGGGGSGVNSSGTIGEAGGGGGGYIRGVVTKVEPTCSVTVGVGGAVNSNGGNSNFTQTGSVSMTGFGGARGNVATGGAGGSFGISGSATDVNFFTGGNGGNSTGSAGGGGGSGARQGADGVDGHDGSVLGGGPGGMAAHGGFGGDGGDEGIAGQPGLTPGGGGGGGGVGANGAAGAAGLVIVTCPPPRNGVRMFSGCCCGLCRFCHEWSLPKRWLITIADTTAHSGAYDGEYVIEGGDILFQCGPSTSYGSCWSYALQEGDPNPAGFTHLILAPGLRNSFGPFPHPPLDGYPRVFFKLPGGVGAPGGAGCSGWVSDDEIFEPDADEGNEAPRECAIMDGMELTAAFGSSLGGSATIGILI